MPSILQVLTSQSFVETALTLLVTAALTGLLVPVIKAKMDDRNFRKRRQFEEDLARQGKLIDYQAKLLDEIAESLWQYQALALEPTYYKQRANEAGYKVAIEQYDQKAPILLSQIRAQISKVRRFSSEEVYGKFYDLYDKKLIPLDVWIINLVETGSSRRGDWSQHHSFTYTDIGSAIDECLFLLAKEYGLSGNRIVAHVSTDK